MLEIYSMIWNETNASNQQTVQNRHVSNGIYVTEDMLKKFIQEAVQLAVKSWLISVKDEIKEILSSNIDKYWAGMFGWWLGST